jgi:hypothetical protein
MAHFSTVSVTTAPKHAPQHENMFLDVKASAWEQQQFHSYYFLELVFKDLIFLVDQETPDSSRLMQLLTASGIALKVVSQTLLC